MKRVTILLIILLWVTPVFSLDYYVDDACTAGGTGTTSGCGDGATRPFKTLAAAISGVPSGNNTIHVAAGTYTEARVTDSVSGSDPGYRHWLASGTVNISNGFVISGNYVKFQGFTLTTTSTYSWMTAASGAIQSSGDYNVILSNTCTGATQDGIYLTSASSYNTVQGNTIVNCHFEGIHCRGANHLILSNDISHIKVPPPGESWYDANAIAFFGNNHTFRGNYIHDIPWSDQNEVPQDVTWLPHIDAFQTYDGADGCIIERNFVFLGDTTTGVLEDFWSGDPTGATSVTVFMCEDATNLTIRNNIFEAAHGIKSLEASRPSSNVYIYNNLFRGIHAGPHTYRGLDWGAGSSNFYVWNNIFLDFEHQGYDTGTTDGYNILYNTPGPSPEEPTNIFDNPDLVSLIHSTPITAASATDCKLQVGSPAINAGSTIASVIDDYDGVSRPQGLAYDIGAYEYGATVPKLSGVSIIGGSSL